MSTNKEQKNLRNESVRLYQAIEELLISKPWIASKIYSKEWTDDESVQRRLTIRLRNKLNGNGSITLNEIKAIEDALSEFSRNLKSAVELSKSERTQRLKNKITGLLSELDEDDKKSILNE